MTSGFSNPILGGDTLLRDSIRSNNYIAGSSGWSVNKDGSAEFNGVTVRGTVILGNNVIVLDDTRNAIFVYNVGALVASIASGSGTDGFGNVYQGGIVSYDATNVAVFSQLISGELLLSANDVNQVQGFLAHISLGYGPANDQPAAILSSPTDNGFPTPVSALLELIGADVGNAHPPIMRTRSAAGVDMDFVHQGEIKYGAPGINNYGETWHAFNFAASWANLGGAWSNAAYRKSNGGTVELTGAIQWLGAATAAPVQITTLPVGYRPPAMKHLITATMPAPASTPQIESIEVRADGTVWLTNYPAGGPNTPITLEGLWFPLGN